MFQVNLCCGARKRTAAFIAGGGALAISLGLILMVAILLITSYRETADADIRRALGSLYSASLVVFGSWSLLTFVLLGGIRVENKRALLLWIAFTGLVPLLFVIDLAYLAGTGHTSNGEVAYLVVLAICVLLLVYIALVIYVYYLEIKERDKNPDLRENELTFAMPYGINPPPTGAANTGFGASESSIPRSRQANDPSSADQWKGRGTDSGRQSRYDATYGNADGKGSRSGSRAGSRDNSAEREGGTTYYRYQYTTEKYHERHHGSQGSLTPSRQGLGGGVDSTV